MTNTKQLDLEKLEKVIQNVDMGQFVAFEDDIPAEEVDCNVDSIKKSLNEFGKIFLEIGFWGYDDEYGDEPYFMIDGDPIDEIDESDSYYEKYHYHVAGYGIFLDKEYNVENGYYTTAPPPTGHGMGYTTFHDFNDARENDFIRDKLIECINTTDIWK